MKTIKLAILFTVLILVQYSFAIQPEKKNFLVTGYINSAWIKTETDLEFIKHLDRICFFGMAPDENGAFSVSDDYISKYKLIRSKMQKGQKILLVVGGGREVENMHIMGTDSATREAYIDDLVVFAKRYKFDGIDIDWETNWKAKPVMDVPTDKLIALLTGIKSQMPKGSILTSALGGSSAKQAVAIQNLVEDVSVMLYSTLNKEGLHAPLYTVKERLKKYTGENYPNNKLLVGVPFYGLRADKKVMLYRDIVKNLTPGDTASVYDGYSFNSVSIMKEKVKYLKEQGYRGIMIWETTQDAPYNNSMSLLRGICTEAETK